MSTEYNDEEILLRQSADSLDITEADKLRYMDLSRIPFDQRTPEVHESIERLILVGQGLPAVTVQYYLDIVWIPVCERTQEQRKLIADVLLHTTECADTNTPEPIAYSPLVRERLEILYNHLSIRPRSFSPAYNALIQRLEDDLQRAIEEE